jgi:hypothetical protein
MRRERSVGRAIARVTNVVGSDSRPWAKQSQPESRINKLPRWARDYIYRVQHVGAEEVEELIQLRNERRQLIKLIAELKAENRRLRHRLEAKR